jgi:hypothetical protein
MVGIDFGKKVGKILFVVTVGMGVAFGSGGGEQTESTTGTQ